MRALPWLIAVLLFSGAVGKILFLLKEPSPPVFPTPGWGMVTRSTTVSPHAQLAIVDLNGTPWVTIEQNHNNVKVEVPPAGWTRLIFVLRNTGNVSLVRPLYRFVASPESVHFRNNYNIDQLRSGNDVPSYSDLPYSASGTTDTQISVDLTVPAAVANFDLTFESSGLPSGLETKLHFAATHQQ